MKKFFYSILLLCATIGVGQAQTIGSDVPKLDQLYQQTTQELQNAKHTTYSPLIGISTSLSEKTSYVNNTYIISVIKAGGTPVMIPNTTDMEVLHKIVNQLDGIILTGGDDVNPAWYNEDPKRQLGSIAPERDIYDLNLAKLAYEKQIPTLGICRGLQILNVAFGGTLYQDIPSQRANHIKHNQDISGSYATHRAFIEKQSVLSTVLGKDTVMVNSFHHQAIKDVASIFKVVATAPDGIIEAIEAYPNHPIMGFQWHPEALTKAGDQTMLKVFKHFLDQANKFHQKK